MNINTLINTMRDAIADDTATKSWCTTNYGQIQKVYSGIDIRNPPAEADCPLVDISKGEKDNGYDDRIIRHIINVTCEIYDTDARIVAGKSNVIEYEFVQNIESFRKLVETAVVTALTTAYPLIWVSRLRTTYEEIEFFPFIDATMVFELTEDYYQGDEVFA